MAKQILALLDAPRRADGRPGGTRCGDRGCAVPTVSQAHCSVCHLTFRSVTNFDAHRSKGYCIDPASIELVDVDGVWASSEGHAQAAEYRRRIAHAHALRNPGAGVEARTPGARQNVNDPQSARTPPG